MNSDQTILSEIQAISPAVANLPKTNPFTVPLDYFENNISILISIINGTHSNDQKEVLNFNLSIEKSETIFELPNDYFESFSNKLMNKIHSVQTVDDELRELAPELISLRTKNPFSAPKGYFDSNLFVSPTRNSGITRVFQMKNLMRYAAAACIIGLIGISYIVTKVDRSMPMVANTSNNHQAAELSLDDMVVYLDQMEGIGHDNELELLSGDETNLLVDLNQQTIQELLNGIPDKGILEFIENEGIILEKNIN
jgi:hypothetical protein